eukprot:TRINITY_DN10441_c0_g1_i1.p1 TRINITY_DN10441_c0_g1~~TRINITY_DN10441_c0_g1_i1.p1  ORF type:complete len:750 (-),score=179.55 TRINITY_DN10441_c0_g1_i1:98-2281(-)
MTAASASVDSAEREAGCDARMEAGCCASPGGDGCAGASVSADTSACSASCGYPATAVPAAATANAAEVARSAGAPTGAANEGVPCEAAEAKKAAGNERFQAKDFAKAAELYTEAIELAGANALPVYFSNRAVCRAALECWEAAREDASKALEFLGVADSVAKKALFQKARAELRLRLGDAAEATLQAAAQRGLRADLERMLKAEGLKSSAAPASTSGVNGVPAAVSAGDKANEASSHTASTPAQGATAAGSGVDDEAARAKERGNAKYKEGAYLDALGEYKRAVGLVPEGDAARKALYLGNAAAACLMLRRAGECARTCEESLALDRGSAKVRSRLALARLASGNFDAARLELSRASADGGCAADDPALIKAKGQIDEAERVLREADKARQEGMSSKALGLYAGLESGLLFENSALMLKMGRCYLEMRNYPRAINATQQVLMSNPQNVDALVLRAEALCRNNGVPVDSKQWPEALEQGQRLLKQALSYDPDHSEAQALRKRLRNLCNAAGEIREAMGSREFENARNLLDGMITNASDNAILLSRLHNERAKASVRLKDWKSVIKDVGQAIYRDHEFVQPYFYRVQAFQALERHEDAVRELESLFNWHREQNVYEKLQEAKFLLRKSKRADYYALMNVPSVASGLEIKKAYREKASEWHPDKKSHLDEAARKHAEEMFKRIGEAYEVLTDPVKKELYDKGYDLEGIQEQLELKKRRTGGGCCGPGGCH